MIFHHGEDKTKLLDNSSAYVHNTVSRHNFILSFLSLGIIINLDKGRVVLTKQMNFR